MVVHFLKTPVCFQEVAQLATEEVSIFRQMGPADCLSSLVIGQLNSGSKVGVFISTRGSDDTGKFGCLGPFLFICVRNSSEDAFSHFRAVHLMIFVESDARVLKCDKS